MYEVDTSKNYVHAIFISTERIFDWCLQKHIGENAINLSDACCQDSTDDGSVQTCKSFPIQVIIYRI